MKTIITSLLLYIFSFSVVHSQENKEQTSDKTRFLGSSLFVLANFLPDPPSFYQLNYGYRLTPKDTIVIEAITWEYTAPLGIPYGPSFESKKEKYPGYVKDIGIGLAYQRFIHKIFFTSIHLTPFRQQYFDQNNEQIQVGFQLFLTLRFGYHLMLFNDSFFIEPSIAFTHWPINTNVPNSFKEKDNNWPNYFLFEPGLHFGMKF